MSKKSLKKSGKKYDPDQPRDPGGEGGGRWVKTGASAEDEDDLDAGQSVASLSTDEHQKVIDNLKDTYSVDEMSDMMIEDVGEDELLEALGESENLPNDFDAGNSNASYLKDVIRGLGADEAANMLIGLVPPGVIAHLLKDKDAEKSGVDKMSKRLLFVPITKMDEEKRLVYGIMADETPDRAGEIFDYETSKPHFEKWSGDIHKASDGKSYGNVRVMHTAKAAGKLDQIAFNDDNKEIECVAKVVDDDEWKKCLEGVYTGFSIGGKYVKKWKGEDGNYRYTASPAEVSLVDSSCNTSCNFALQKADGSEVLVDFKPYIPDNADILAQAEALAKAAGHTNWALCIDDARDALVKMHEGLLDADGEDLAKAFEKEDDAGEEDGEKAKEEKKSGKGKKKPDKAEGEEEAAAEGEDEEEEAKEGGEVDKAAAAEQALGEVEQVWKAKDGKTFVKKADAVTYQAGLLVSAITDPVKKAIADLKKSFSGEAEELPLGAEAGTPAVFADLSKAHKAVTGLAALVEDNDILEKSMYDVQSFASALQSVAYVQESLAWSGSLDNQEPSPIAVALKEQVSGLAATFIALAIEECAGLVARLKPTQIDQILADVATQEVDPTADPEVGVAVAQAVKFLKEDNDILAKRGARNSKRDAATLQKAHDSLVALGVACAEKDMKKLDDTDDLAKMAVVVAENDELKKTLAGIVPEIAELKKIADEWKKLPQAGAPRTHVIEKGQDLAKVDGSGDAPMTLEDVAKNYTPEQIAAAYIRLSQQNPQDAMKRG